MLYAYEVNIPTFGKYVGGDDRINTNDINHVKVGKEFTDHILYHNIIFFHSKI